MTNDSTDALNAETRELWNQKAEFWDNLHGDEGNMFQRLLIAPATERLLQIQPGERVLEVACGNGVMSRRMAELGAHVLATDFSSALIERARARNLQYAGRIEYRVTDATSEEALLRLGTGFDAVVCNMALMDMATIDPLAAALPKLLQAQGRFVFSLTHPCFNNSGLTMMGELEDREGTMVRTYSVKISQYLGFKPQRGGGAPGEPVPHYYFERPLHLLLGTFFRVGLVMDGMEEPAFDPSVQGRSEVGWNGNFHEIPPVFAARLRLQK